MSPALQQLLFKHQRQALVDLAVLSPEARDLDAASFFEQFDEPGEAGFRDRGCSRTTMIVLPGPKEADRRAHLHIEQRYETQSPHELRFYRLEICWGCDVVLPAPANDYLRDSILSLRRGVRFDHHPRIQDALHPPFHWHPNGCSEFRLSTGRMTPLKTAALAFMMFDGERLAKACEASGQLKHVVADLRREMPSLPDPG